MTEAKATREGYGDALTEVAKINKNVIALDADLNDSTRSDYIKKVDSKRERGVYKYRARCVKCGQGTTIIGLYNKLTNNKKFTTQEFFLSIGGNYYCQGLTKK